MKLSFFRRRSWKKHLAIAVTAGLLAGAYAPGAWAESGIPPKIVVGATTSVWSYL